MTVMLKKLVATTAMALLVLSGLTACGGGAQTTANPPTTTVTASNYTGPAPATADVQSFKLNVWDNLKATNRCGACHVEGNQTPEFVRQDDVNTAYTAANGIVDLSSPKDSRMVTKVAAGHNCWLSSPQACADVIQAYIEAWAGGVAGGSRAIQLVAPPLKDPGNTKNFPTGPPAPAGFNGLYTLLTGQAQCLNCHRSDSATPQAPFFAAADIDEAYEAAKSKIDLNNPANSRFVVRVRDEFHNCWTSDCATDAADLLAQIQNFAATISPTQVDPQLVISKALSIVDGVVASGGSRHEANQIALYEFKTGSGNTAFDTSGIEPGMHLSLSGDVTWVGGYGIQINAGKAQASTATSKKLNDLIKATSEYSIEAWVAPANVTQQDARIISYSAGTTERNFTLGQTQYNYDFFHRSSNSNANGDPALSTADADEDLQATLQHVVVTYDPVNGRRIYVNGVFTGDMDPVQTGNLNSWDDSFAFVLGNEVSGDRQWQGVVRMVAIHNRALTQEQIAQNFNVGVGQKFFLLFSVEHLVNVPQSYIMFEVSQFDSYSYQFLNPTFISLDANASPASIPIKAMRIGINGKEAKVGQAWRNLDVNVDASQYTPESGQLLSTIGTIIALENGPNSDEFFLSFEQIGSNTNVVTDPTVPVSPLALEPSAPADIGLRTFDEISMSMAEITGVSPSLVNFNTVRQALPSVETFEGFLPAHQMAIAQLSLEYCDAMVEDNGLRDAFFGPVDFNNLNTTQVIDALYNKIVGLPDTATGNMLLTSAPPKAQIATELNALQTRLCTAGCDAQRNRKVVKAMCGAVLGNASLLVQ